MKPSRVIVLAGASATMLAAGWTAGVTSPSGLVLADGSSSGVITTDPLVTPSPTASAGATSTDTTAASTTTAPTAPELAPPPPPPAGPTGTFVGPSVGTAYGNMQVQIVVSDGTITDVQPLVIGLGDGTSRQINANAVPTLEARVLSAQSANVSYVSGASYTSQGFLASVAGAMSAAGI